MLAGMGLIPDPNDTEAINAMVKTLEANLIIIRDQTHVGQTHVGKARGKSRTTARFEFIVLQVDQWPRLAAISSP